MKKCKVLSLIVLGILLLNSITYASVLEVVDSNSKNNIKNEDIKFTKKIINYDAEMKEAEIELYIENLNKIEEDKQDVEIMLILDNSYSMSTVENNNTRKSTTYNATKKFVDMLYSKISNLKVGVIQYSDGVQFLSELTESKTTVDSALEKYKNNNYGKSTGTDKALKSVQSKFSKDCKNKIVVLLTDGYPGKPDETKKELKVIGNSDISIFSLIVCKKNNVKSIQNVFGTEQAPTAGKVYYIENDNEIDRVFSEFTYNEIIKYLDHRITDISIEDIFPEDILEYYDIEYSGVPSMGKVDDLQNNGKFIWKIDQLIGQENAVFKYKIKIKDNVDISKIIGIEMETNETVNIKYKNETGKEIQKILDKQPIIKIEDDVHISGIVEDDDTVDKNKIPVEKNENEVSIDDTEEKQEFVIVDVTPQEDNKVQEVPKKNIQQTQTNKTTPGERLPQTGNWYETAIGISILLSIILAIKIKLSTKEIHIIRK